MFQALLFLFRHVVSGDLFELTVDHLDSVNGGSCGQIIFRTQSGQREQREMADDIAIPSAQKLHISQHFACLCTADACSILRSNNEPLCSVLSSGVAT